MAKKAPDAMIDASLDYVAQADGIMVCSAEPADYTAAYTTLKMAGSSALTTASYTIDDAAGGGRKVTVAATSGLSIDVSTAATHIALVSTGDTTLRYVTTCTSQELTSGVTVDIPAWIITIGDPT